MLKSVSQLTIILLFVALTASFVILFAQENETNPKTTPEKLEPEESKLTKEELKAKYQKLLAELGNDEFKLREAATEELIKLGKDILPMIEETLETTKDPEVKMRLNHVKEQLTKITEKPPANENQRAFPPLKFKVMPGGVISSMTAVDSSGKYTLSQSQDGKVKVTIEPKDGEKVTKEFESMEKFKEEMPEIAKKFAGMGSLRLKIEPRMTPRNNDDENDENPTPESEMERLRKELEKRFGESFPDIEELMKKLEELGKNPGREFNPFPKNREENQQFYRASRTDDEGNTYELIIKDGKVTAIFKPKNGEPVVKKFDNIDTFKKELPEFYGLFPNLEKELQIPENRKNPTPENQTEENKPENQIEDAKFGDVTPVLRAQLAIKDGEGLIVKELTSNDAAEKGFFTKAGIEKFDIITLINKKPVISLKMLADEIKNANQGDEFNITIIRRGVKMELKTVK